MAEYISRDAAIAYLERHKRIAKKQNIVLAADEDSIIKFLKGKCPAADVVPVVRCRDCKHMYCCSAVDRMFHCRHPKGLKGMPNIVEENPFCPYGERREGE